MTARSRLLECLGGSLDGDVLELPPDAARYVVLDARGAPAETYLVRPVVKRGAAGHVLWERNCLVLSYETELSDDRA